MRFIRDMIREKSRAELAEAPVLAADDAQDATAFHHEADTSWEAALPSGEHDLDVTVEAEQGGDADAFGADDETGLDDDNLDDDNLFAAGSSVAGDAGMDSAHRDANGMEIADPEDDPFAEDAAPSAGFDLSALRREFAANPSFASHASRAAAADNGPIVTSGAGRTAPGLNEADEAETVQMADLTRRMQQSIDSAARAETPRAEQPGPSPMAQSSPMAQAQPEPQAWAQAPIQRPGAAAAAVDETPTPPRHRETTRHVMETLDAQMAELTAAPAAPSEAPQGAAPERPHPTPQPVAVPDDPDDTADFDDQVFDVAAIAAAAQRPTAGRAGRVKTRLLGFNTSGEQVENPFAKAAKTERPGEAQFPVGWLVVIDGPGRGQSFTLFHGVSQIGRGEDQAIRLDFGDNSISRQNHAAIAYDAETRAFYLGHGGKANLVRLNERPVLSTEELVGENHIRIGETTLKFVALCGADFDWEQSETEGELHVQAR